MAIESFFLHSLRQSGITKDLDDDCLWLSKLLDSRKVHINNKTFPYIIAMDSFVEGIHFCCVHKKQKALFAKQHSAIEKLGDSHIMRDFPFKNTQIATKRYCEPMQWLSYEDIAKKAFLVNISDIVSSGALPKYALLALSLPYNFSKTAINEILHGIIQICKQYRIMLIGGDTTQGEKLGFHITMIGVLQGQYLQRKNIKHGDFVAYTSSRNANLGNSLKSLTSLLRYGAFIHKIPKNCIESKNPYAKFACPTIRSTFLFKAQKMLHTCMDISDGLGNEIQQLESLNSLQFKAFSMIPKQIYQSGEEYELLFTFAPKYKFALQKIAESSRIRIHIIGKFTLCKKTSFHTIQWH